MDGTAAKSNAAPYRNLYIAGMKQIPPLREYRGLKETAYLLGTPANARHLQRGLDEFAAGGFSSGEQLDIPAGTA